MRLVFLYGPPAAGKLTVARELAALTGFKLLHNHLTIDLVNAVFPFGSARFGRLVSRFRREMLAEAALENVDLIFTFVYAHRIDDEEVRTYTAPVQAAGGTVHFVQLTCPRPVLLQRVDAESRRGYKKITDGALLESVLDRHDLYTPVPHGESLRIDTELTTPVDAARRIAESFGLLAATHAS